MNESIDDYQENHFTTKAFDGTVTVHYRYYVVPSGIKKEMKLSSVEVIKVVNNQTGQTLESEDYSEEAHKKAEWDVDARNESLYGI